MRILSLILITLAFLHPSIVKALTRTEHVTNPYLVAHPDFMSVKVVEKEEGMLTFTTEFMHRKFRHVVAHMEVRDDSRTYSESHTPMFTRTEKSTYFFSIPREFIRTSTYSLNVSRVTGEGVELGTFSWSKYLMSSFKPSREANEPIPVVGSIIYEICLSDFVSPNLPNDNCTNEVVIPTALE